MFSNIFSNEVPHFAPHASCKEVLVGDGRTKHRTLTLDTRVHILSPTCDLDNKGILVKGVVIFCQHRTSNTDVLAMFPLNTLYNMPLGSCTGQTNAVRY